MVTEPSKCKVEQAAATSEGGNPSPISSKRKLPAWLSPSKSTKKETKKVDDAGDGTISSGDAEEISVSRNKKSIPKGSRPEKKQSARGKKNLSAAIKEQGKEVNARHQKSPELCKSTGSPHHGRKSSKQGKREGSPRPAGPKQQSKRRHTHSRNGSDLSTSEGNSSPDSHQLSPPTAPLDRPESSKDPSGQAHSQVRRSHGSKEGTESRLSTGESSKKPLQSHSTAHKPRQASASTLPFSKFLNGVVFAISGLVNPERAELRDKALEMGGQYRPDWSSDCTMLICAYADTPKFNQVKNDNGTVVSKVWIQECYLQKRLVEIEKYLLHVGKPWRQIEESAADACEEEFDEELGLGCDDSTTLGSLRDIQKWVHEDVAASITWLKQQETQPEATELESVALQGIQLCLDDTIECLKNKQSIEKIVESWDYVPRGVQELAMRAGKAGKKKPKSFWSDMLSEAERLKWMYSKELEKIEKFKEGKLGKQNLVDDEDDATDASTDVMPEDSLSDNTQVLDEEEIREAEEAVSKLLSGQHRK